MSTASGLSTEELASNVFGTKAGGGLQAFFTPQNIAVIGATDKADSIGRTLVRNLFSSPFGGAVFPINRVRSRQCQGFPRNPGRFHPESGLSPSLDQLGAIEREASFL